MSNIEYDNRSHEPVKIEVEYAMGDKELYCPLCRCSLYDGFSGGSDASDSSGVFQLSNASYCPQCGVKFIKE